jgi:hypothetical protein
MKTNKQMLSSILKTTQLSQMEIRSILDTSMRPGLRKALEGQLLEYTTIENEAHSIASARGWELTEVQPARKLLSDMSTHMKLTYGNTDSKIAGLLIQNNTNNMIRGLKNVHQYNGQDSQVSTLCQKLLDCETANIRQLQNFL